MCFGIFSQNILNNSGYDLNSSQIENKFTQNLCGIILIT